MFTENTLLRLLILVLFSFVGQNYAATKVLYEFHIRQVNIERNETGVINNSNNHTKEPELIITGKRTSNVILTGQGAESGNSVYKEIAEYTADDSGYHVKYNISIEPLELDTRLNGKTLKVIVG